MMERSNGVGLLAVCAVSWSVALLAFQAHKRLVSDFMKKMESELNGRDDRENVGSCCTKKVRFAEDVTEPSSSNKEYRRSRRSCSPRTSERSPNEHEPVSPEDQWNRTTASMLQDRRADNDDSMPLNRQALYKGIIKYRMLKCQNLPKHF